jgi:hypothetical protein
VLFCPEGVRLYTGKGRVALYFSRAEPDMFLKGNIYCIDVIF